MLWPESRGCRKRGTAGALLRAVLALGVVMAPAAAPLAAQSAVVGTASADTASLGHGPFSRMHTLLEKTIFQVDVLTLDVRFGERDTERIARLARGRSYSDELADSIAGVAIRSQDAWAQIEFKRDVSLDQFLDGVGDNLKRAWEAGVIDRGAYEMVSDGLPRWFAFLEERGIRKGDRIFYRIRGDSLRTRFVGANGAELLDQVDVGPERRRAVLGSYFVRGSDFREGLIESLFEN